MNILAIIIVLIILVLATGTYALYGACTLNTVLPAKLKNKKCVPAAKPSTSNALAGAASGFVGAMAQHPHLVPLSARTSPSWYMHRGNYA